MPRAGSDPPRWLSVTTGAAAVCCLALIVPFFVSYDLSFVHPQRLRNHLPTLVPDSIAFTRWDLVLLFQEFDQEEFRPRFLTYLLILIDLKLRLASYAWGVPHPALSVSWLPQVVLAPWLLYRLLMNLTGDRHGSALGVLFYVTSIGFLSGITMVFAPAKPLSNVVFIAVLYLMSVAVKRAAPGTLFHETRSAAVPAVLLVTFAALFLDETTLFTPLLIVVVFVDRFLGDPRRASDLKRMTKSAVLFALPLVAFLIVVIVVAPAIIRRFYAHDPNYLATLYHFGSRGLGKWTFVGQFGLGSFGSNLLSLLGVAFVPWQGSPFVDDFRALGALSSQETNAVQLLLVAGFGVAVALAARRMPPETRRYFGRLLVATVLFVLFQSLLAGRHVPYIIGYYYGSAFSVLLALVVGMAVSALGRGARRRLVALGVVVLVVVIQVGNFDRINRSWISVHERQTYSWFENAVPIAAGERVSSRELSAIWAAWKAGRLGRYLDEHAVSPGAVFLVVELRWLDKLRGGGPPT